MKKTKWVFLLLACFFCVEQLLAQTAKLSGKVVDAATNEPLAGVTVIVKATKKGTSTNVDGSFTLSIKEGETIEVSYLGYGTVSTKASKDAIIKLTALTGSNLQDVVVVGYGTQKRNKITAAVATVKGEQLIARPSSNASMALQGFVAGLTVRQNSGQPGADVGLLNIRGVGSLGGNSFPLIIVDGVEGVSLNDVDPNIIESISVLKDAASTAVYCVRATNGVILVKTKRGVNGKTSLAFNSFISQQDPTNMPKTLSAVDNMLLMNEALTNAGQAPLFPQTQIDLYRNTAPNNFSVFNTDWQRLIFQNNGLLQNHNVIVSGGSEKSSFLASGTYLSQQGLIVNNRFTKFDLRLNGDINITNKIKFTTDLFYTRANNLVPTGAGAAPSTIIQRAISMARQFPGKFEDGKYGDAGQSNAINPIGLAEMSGTTETETPTLSMRFALKAEVVKNLFIEVAYNNRTANSRTISGSRPYEVYVPNLATGTLLPSPSNPLAGGIDSSIGYATNRFNSNQYYASVSYNFDIAREHKFKTQVGFQALDNTTETSSATRFGWQYFDRPYLNLATSSAQPQVSSGETDNANAGVFGRLNYDYRDKYIFEFSGRWDGSSRFSQLYKKQNGWFSGFSAGWVISKEAFFESIKAVSFAKLRLSYGSLGNQEVNRGDYTFITTLNPGTANYFNNILTRGFSLNNIPSLNLSWETSTQKNIGVDIGLLKNKLNITFDYYEKNVKDMIIDNPLPLLAGYTNVQSVVPINAGEMVNKGWEFSATYKETYQNFRYSVTANLSDVTNKVLFTNNQRITTREGLIAQAGFPVNSYLLYKTNGLYQLGDNFSAPTNGARPTGAGDIKYVDMNKDGIINADDRVLMGNNFPRYEYSTDINLGYKNFDLNIFIYGVGKRDNYISGIGVEPFNAPNWISSGFVSMLDRWTPTNPNAKYPRLYTGGNGNYVPSDFWLRNGAFLRVKHITLGYSLSKKIMEKAKLQQFRVYVSVVNPFTISDYEPGFDPEISNQNGGQNGAFYPIMRTATVGFNIKF